MGNGEKKHNEEAEWLREVRRENEGIDEFNVTITMEMVKEQAQNKPDQKLPGRDREQGVWLKKFESLHGSIATQLDEALAAKKDSSEWMAYGGIILCLKYPTKGNAVDNFKPISCLPLMLKLLTGLIAEKMYEHREKTSCC